MYLSISLFHFSVFDNFENPWPVSIRGLMNLQIELKDLRARVKHVALNPGQSCMGRADRRDIVFL